MNKPSFCPLRKYYIFEHMDNLFFKEGKKPFCDRLESCKTCVENHVDNNVK